MIGGKEMKAATSKPKTEKIKQETVAPKPEPAQETKGKKLEYTRSGYANLRTYPNTGHIIGAVKKGDVVEEIESLNNGWAKVQLPDGTVGYCISKYFKEEK